MNPLPEKSAARPWGPALVLLTVFFVLVGGAALRPSLVNDPDVWWHLRTGQWIFEHRAVPVTDPFSQVGAGREWVAYSWLFEVLLFWLYSKFGLTGIVGLTAGLTLAIGAALFAHLRPLVANDKRAIGFTGLGLLLLAPLCNPRAWLFTILFFILEYAWLAHARRTGKSRRLWVLPVLFALWANLHLQFIYGLFLLGFATVEPLLERWWRRDFSRAAWLELWQPQRWLLFALCAAATLATPYHVKVYGAILEIAGQTGVYQHIAELRPLTFDSLTPWVMLAATLWAMFKLGRQPQPQPGQVLLLLLGVLLAFRSSRDSWFLLLPLLTILAQPAPEQGTANFSAAPTPQFASGWRVPALALGLAVIVLLLQLRQPRLSDTTLQASVAQSYPAKAAQVIEARGYRGPLFNHFDWGGYLIWRLPQLPVSMDGRTNLYGADGIARHTNVWRGKRNWAQDPDLAKAGVVLADIEQPLTGLLRFDPRFELVYEDEVAAVFVARSQQVAKR